MTVFVLPSPVRSERYRELSEENSDCRPIVEIRNLLHNVSGPLATQSLSTSSNQTIASGFLPLSLSFGPDGVALLKSIEQLRLKPYDDQTGKDITAWVAGATIGYGHLIAKGEWKSYKKGISEKDADALFDADLAPFVDCVRNTITVGLQQHQFDALVIFAFNIGIRGFKGSSVVRMINDPTTKTGYATLEGAWKSWNKSQGKVNKGLVNRRDAEWNIYNSASYSRW